MEAVIRGYHVYKTIWDARLGQFLSCKQEPGNIHDPYVVSVLIHVDGVFVGHVPRSISSLCYSFLRRNGTLTCEVISSKQYSADLPQGGLQIPCKLIFDGEVNLIDKVRILLKEALAAGLLKPDEGEPQKNKTKLEEPKSNDCLLEPPSKKCRDGRMGSMVLSELDREELCNGSWLSDKHIHFAQSILKKQFQDIDGWRSTLWLGQKKLEKIKQGVQIMHTCANHWLVVSNLGCSDGRIQVFDSLYELLDKKTEDTLLELFHTGDHNAKIKMVEPFVVRRLV